MDLEVAFACPDTSTRTPKPTAPALAVGDRVKRRKADTARRARVVGTIVRLDRANGRAQVEWVGAWQRFGGAPAVTCNFIRLSNLIRAE